MKRLTWAGIALALVAPLLAPGPASAQPLGTFTWQLQPYCNRLTLTVVQSGGVFTLDGYDDQCGTRRAAAAGVAVLNPDGSVNIGITVVTSEFAYPVHVDATLAPGSLSGTWRDSPFSNEGAFAFNAATGGNPRPSAFGAFQHAGGFFATTDSGGGFFFSRGHNGPVSAPTAMQEGDSLGRFGAGGYTGDAYHWPTGLIRMNATENWTVGANGTQIQFMTTPNGSADVTRWMVLDHTGFLGINTLTPVDRLHVNGDIRTQTGCVRNGAGAQIAGVCASDLRLKRDVTAAPPVLDRVRGLRPVHFSWRADEYPERAFGAERTYGLVADEVEDVLPEIVSIDAEGFKRLDYSALPLLAIQAIGELKTENDRLDAQNAELAARLARVEAQLQRLLSTPR